MLSFVDLFCGAGFGARGAVRAGAKPLLAVEAWDIAAWTYASNFPAAKVLHSRVEDVSIRSIASRIKPDVLLTSPECTGHSIARGARRGSEESRETAMSIIRWVDAMNPRWIIVENVNRMKLWHRHDDLVRSLEGRSYFVNDLYLNAADFGTPQARKRLFLVCDRFGTKISRDDLLTQRSGRVKTAESIIDWRTSLPTSPLCRDGRATATLERAQRAIQALGRGVPFIIVYYGSDYAGGWQRLDTPLRTVTTLDRFALVTWKGDQPFMRMLQPSELIRAMGAGRQHVLPYGTRRDKIKLCGNGVCSPVIEAIFRKISNSSGSRQAA